MGKIAQPNTPYCGDFTQGAISAGGQIFTTQNPPISYTLDGATATISDTTGVIGEVDLSGELTEENNGPASQGVEYCEGIPKARLEWSSGLVESQNTPISYTVTPPGQEGVFVDWGDGDTILLSGRTWTVDEQPTQLLVYEDYKNFRGWITVNIALPGADLRNCSATFPYSSANVSIGSSGYDGSTISGFTTYVLAYVDGCEVWRNGNAWTNAGTPADNHQVRGGSIEPGVPIYTVTTNTGATASKQIETPPLVQYIDARYLVSVSDSTGEIFSRGFEEEPVNFVVRCYDYDITEVKYVCEGACPSAEFECRCEASNTLMCYGWDPNDPDIFKPLFTTSITSG